MEMDTAKCKNCGGYYTAHWKPWMGSPPMREDGKTWCLDFEVQPMKLTDCTSDELYAALKKGGLTEIIYEGEPGPGQIKPLAHGKCKHGLAWHKWESGSVTNCCSLCPVPA